jgi:hypothetical protein
LAVKMLSEYFIATTRYFEKIVFLAC